MSDTFKEGFVVTEVSNFVVTSKGDPIHDDFILGRFKTREEAEAFANVLTDVTAWGRTDAGN